MLIEDVQSCQQHTIRAARLRIYLVGLQYLIDSPCIGNLKIIYQPVGGKQVPIWHTEIQHHTHFEPAVQHGVCNHYQECS